MPRRTPRAQDAPNRKTLEDVSLGLRRAAILQAAIELEIFSHIAEGRCTLPAIARGCASAERGIRLLLDALVAIGLLSKELREYRLTPTGETYLVKNKSAYIGDGMLNDFAWDARGKLSKTIRTGKVFVTMRSPFTVEDTSTLWGKIGIPPGKTKKLRVLDVSRARAKWKFGAFDVVLFGSSIGDFRPEQIVGMFRKAYTALAQNGRVVIHAPIADDDTARPKAAMAGIDALLFSLDGDVYTVAEYSGMLEAAGFTDVVNIDDDLGLIVARRINPSSPK